jgi:hypothetical protein
MDSLIDMDLAAALRALADRYGGMAALCNAAGILAADTPILLPLAEAGQASARVIAIDRETGEVRVRDIGPGGHLVLPVAPAYVASQQLAHGATVITIRDSPTERAGATRSAVQGMTGRHRG